MRHRKKFNHLGRTSPHRKAMLSNMATSLIMHKRINTTVAKAKALRSYVEPLITKAKDDSTHSRRVVFSYLQDKQAVTELFREVSSKVGDRPGGYTRIIKLGNRLGDNADMAMIELVDYNDHLLEEKEAKKAKAGRRRRGGKKKAADTAAKKEAAPVVEEAVEEPKAEVEEAMAEAEVKEEAPKAEVKAEAEVMEEAPKTEAKEEVKKEERKEEPKVEAKAEEPAKEEKEEKPDTEEEEKKD
jgi:large subunit ribosomal protein L17